MMIVLSLLSCLMSWLPALLNRKGGYTRIIKQGYRVGDNAQTCVIEYLAG